MRVLLVNNIGSTHAGAEGMIAELMSGLHAHGDKVALLSGNQYSSAVHLNTYEFRSFADSSPWRYVGYLCNPFAYRQLRRAIASFQPDIVHFHNVDKASPWVYAALRGCPAVITVHDHNIFDPTRLADLPTLQPFNQQLADYFTNQPSLRYVAEKLRFAMLRPWYRRAISTAIACSHFYAGALKESKLFRETVVIHNGIALTPVQPYPNGPHQTILFTGRLEAIKGPQTLLQAFAEIAVEFPQAQLAIAGGGPDSETLKEQARQLGLAGRINFWGYIERHKLLAAYADAHVVVIPSQYPDNLPTTCIEAMAAARPVVASRIGGLPEMVQDGHTGYLFESGDYMALAESLRAILKHPAAAKRMGAAGRAFAEREFSSAHYIAETRRLYQRVIKLS